MLPITKISQRLFLSVVFSLSFFEAPPSNQNIYLRNCIVSIKNYEYEVKESTPGSPPGRRGAYKMNISSVGLAVINDGEALASSEDIKLAEEIVNGLVLMPMTQGQFDSLVSWTYFCGERAFSQSTILKCMNAANYKAASLALLEDSGRYRRQLEYNLFVGECLSNNGVI